MTPKIQRKKKVFYRECKQIW